tara:strand:- start:31 stop:150 length:120 start_codon:yes stop_codon:yes gene_type:complete
LKIKNKNHKDRRLNVKSGKKGPVTNKGTIAQDKKDKILI